MKRIKELLSQGYSIKIVPKVCKGMVLDYTVIIKDDGNLVGSHGGNDLDRLLDIIMNWHYKEKKC